MTAALILALLQAADIVTTLKALSRGGSEINPVMAWLFTKFEIRAVLLIKAVAVSAIGYWLALGGFHVVLGLLCAVYVVVVINNLIALR